jgi:hypothetical protein
VVELSAEVKFGLGRVFHSRGRRRPAAVQLVSWATTWMVPGRVEDVDGAGGGQLRGVAGQRCWNDMAPTAFCPLTSEALTGLL